MADQILYTYSIELDPYQIAEAIGFDMDELEDAEFDDEGYLIIRSKEDVSSMIDNIQDSSDELWAFMKMKVTTDNSDNLLDDFRAGIDPYGYDTLEEKYL